MVKNNRQMSYEYYAEASVWEIFMPTFHIFIWLVINSLRPSDAFICVGNLIIIGSENSLSPGRRQAIIWTNDGILLIGPLGTNFSEILIENSWGFLQENAFENIICEMAAILWEPQCVNLGHFALQYTS